MLSVLGVTDKGLLRVTKKLTGEVPFDESIFYDLLHSRPRKNNHRKPSAVGAPCITHN